MPEKTKKQPRAFLKWAGGKSRLVNELISYMPAPSKYNSYYEPFLGAGSMYFAISPRHGRLNDLNKKLIACYLDVKNNCDALISELQNLQTAYRELTSDEERKLYYLDRRTEYNEAESSIGKSALFIFLNKTGFNGMYRENRDGKFNIPFGRQTNPLICDAENIRRVSKDLEGIDLTSLDYKEALEDASKDDFVFLDPPYEPLSDTSSFTEYQPGGFTRQHQRELHDKILELSSKGCFVMMTNSTAQLISDLYSDKTKFHIETIKVRRSINREREGRGKIDEYIIFNYDPKTGKLLR